LLLCSHICWSICQSVLWLKKFLRFLLSDWNPWSTNCRMSDGWATPR
jgi:hypothetical protein